MSSRRGLPEDFDELEFISAIAEAPQVALQNTPAEPPHPAPPPERVPRGRRSRKDDYLARFIEPRRDFSPRHGKSVAIHPEHHAKIQQIVSVVAHNRFSIFHYIDNLLCDHLQRYENEIAELYNEKSPIKPKSR